MITDESGSPTAATGIASGSTHLRHLEEPRQSAPGWTRRAHAMSGDDEGSEPFSAAVSLLNDEYARGVLAIADTEPVSATELAERIDALPQTVYRRVETLTDAGLLAEATRPRSDGHHESVYVATFDELRVRLEDGSFDASIEASSGEDAADRLTDLWRRF